MCRNYPHNHISHDNNSHQYHRMFDDLWRTYGEGRFGDNLP